MTKQYIELASKILEEGQWVDNERTGKRCKTIINHTLTYEPGEFPLVTTRKSFWKAAVAELTGYMRGYNNAEQFSNLGSPTWNANANDNQAWLENPHRKGHGDMGKVYGAIARDFGGIDLIENVYENLSKGIDTRGEIITFWRPDDFDKGCLRPCMFQHQFSILGDTLHLTSYQRAVDTPLGLSFNMVQVYTLLAVMAQVTGLKQGVATHHLVNIHVYEDQLELFKEQAKREPMTPPTLHIDPTLDWDAWMNDPDILQYFNVVNYRHHDPIKYPFSV